MGKPRAVSPEYYSNQGEVGKGELRLFVGLFRSDSPLLGMTGKKNVVTVFNSDSY
jgi:hypothetical protein